MTAAEVLSRLESLGNASTFKTNAKNGAQANKFGVKMGDLRAVAKEIKSDHALGLELWKTGNLEAMLVATLILNVKQITSEELDSMVEETPSSLVADWLSTNILKAHPEKESLRVQFLGAKDPMRLRAGWSLTAERIIKSPEGLDFDSMLDRIEAEMGGAPALVQWTMNFCLAEIGIHFPAHRQRALAIGEKLGVFRDYPTSKGCTSPFAPIWINAMVQRQSPS